MTVHELVGDRVAWRRWFAPGRGDLQARVQARARARMQARAEGQVLVLACGLCGFLCVRIWTEDLDWSATYIYSYLYIL